MEDRILVSNITENINLYIVLDGHGGKEVVDTLLDLIPKNFKRINYTDNDDTIAENIALKFIDIDLTLYRKNIRSGSTLSGALVFNNSKIFLINLGDSKTILIHNNKIKLSTLEHKPRSESVRIKKSGGIVLGNRVGGRLAMSRSFGDFDLGKIKDNKYISGGAVTVLPDITITPYYNNGTIIIATDGLWDIISLDKILELNYSRGSHDNISTIVIKL